MVSLPVIVGFGGINSAGRGSFHHAYRRTLLDVLPSEVAEETLVDLAVMMNQAKFENELKFCVMYQVTVITKYFLAAIAIA